MRYESYKPSGVAWLGEIPEHWDSKYLGACFSERREKVSDKVFKPLSVTKKGIVPQLETAAKSNAGDNRKKVLKGDFVINGRSDRKGSSGISYLDGSVSLINIVLKPKELFLSKYTHYLLRSVPFQEEYYRNGKGIVADLWSTNISEMRKILLPIPTIEEQEAIVRYLSFYEHKINKAIHVKKKLIATLSEQKQAIIAHAVTKGVDLHVKMKKSGISWLGEIPEHWEMKKIKYIAKVNPSSKYSNIKPHEEVEFVPMENVDEIFGKIKKYNFRKLFEVSSGYTAFKNNDVIFAKITPCMENGNCVIIKDLRFDIAFGSTEFIVFRADQKQVTLDFLHLSLRNKQLRLVCEQNMKGSAGQKRISSDFLGNYLLPIPPLEEQKAIVEFIEQETATIDKAIELSKKEIELLEEYKTRLIADVVTGAVDVREEAQNLPQIEEDSAAFESEAYEAEEEEISDE